MFDFQAVLVECRKRLARHRSGFRKWFGLATRLAYDPRDDVSLALQPHYRLLLESGDVAWGALAQVNARMFLPGADDLPGVTVYSSDPHFDANPQDLRDVAAAL